MNYKVIFGVLCWTLVAFAIRADRLLTAQIVFRHGARQAYYNTSHVDYYTGNNWGELTNVGMRQQYVLGKQLRKQYDEIFKLVPPEWNHTFIYIRSTNFNRTLMSVYSQLQGLYGMPSGPLITADQINIAVPPWPNASRSIPAGNQAIPGGYQPIPIHSEKTEDQKILDGWSDAVCPISARILKENVQSPSVAAILAQESVTVANFKNITNETNISLETIYDYMDTWIVNKYADPVRPRPENMTEELWTNLTYLHSIYGQIARFQHSFERNLYSTPFFQDLIKNFDDILTQDLNSYRYRLFVNSAHDTTIGLLEGALNLTSWECIRDIRNRNYTGYQCLYDYPIFASNMEFELRLTEQGEPYIMIRVNGRYQKICNNNSYTCPYELFKSQLKAIQVDDYDGLCGRKKSQQVVYQDKISGGLLAAIIVLCGLIIVLTMLMLMQNNRLNLKKEEEKNQLFNLNRLEETKPIITQQPILQIDSEQQPDTQQNLVARGQINPNFENSMQSNN